MLIFFCSGLEVKIALAILVQLRPFPGYFRTEVLNTDQPGLYEVFHDEVWTGLNPDHRGGQRLLLHVFCVNNPKQLHL